MGVSTYARSLVDAVSGMGARPHVLWATHPRASAVSRWCAAFVQDGQPVSVVSPAGDGLGRIEGRDVFRRAHVRFRARRRILSLRCEIPFGIMHWSYPVPLAMEGWINLYTVHDAIPLTRPDLTPIRADRHRALLHAILARSSRLVTVSEAARQEIVQAVGCDADRVVNCGQTVQAENVGSAGLPSSLTAGGYLLYCGSIEPRKNLSALLTAYSASGVAMPLVIVGPDAWKSAPIVKALANTPGAVRLPYLEREDLLALIQNARAMLFPSLAEGFGLPVAEAMALGAPVMTSNRGALAEIADGAALLVDPEEVDAMARSILRLATDDDLCDELSRLGRVRAGLYSRAAFVTKLAAVYQSALAEHDSASERTSVKWKPVGQRGAS